MSLSISTNGSSLKTLNSLPQYGNNGQIVFSIVDNGFYTWANNQWVPVSSATGSGSNSNNQINPFLSYEANISTNILFVRNNIASSANQFNSIASALNSIGTTSPTNSYIIYVYPGVYIENQLDLKPYVYIIGASSANTIIEPMITTQYIFKTCENSGIMNCLITGASGTGGVGILHISNAIGPGVIRDVYLGSNESQMKIQNIGSISSVELTNVRIKSSYFYKYGISIFNSTNAVTTLRLNGVLTSQLNNNNPADYFLYVEGTNTSVYLSDCIIRGGATGIGLKVSESAKVVLTNCYVTGFSTCLLTLNNTLSKGLFCYSTSIEGTTNYDLDISYNTLGNFEGNAAKTRIRNNSQNFNIFISDTQDYTLNYFSNIYLNNNDLNQVHNINNIPAQLATINSSGFMSSQDKSKLNNIIHNYKEYIQANPLAVWIINHNFGERPNIRVMDDSNVSITGYTIEDIDVNNVKLTFGISITGTAILN